MCLTSDIGLFTFSTYQAQPTSRSLHCLSPLSEKPFVQISTRPAPFLQTSFIDSELQAHPTPNPPWSPAPLHLAPPLPSPQAGLQDPRTGCFVPCFLLSVPSATALSTPSVPPQHQSSLSLVVGLSHSVVGGQRLGGKVEWDPHHLGI